MMIKNNYLSSLKLIVSLSNKTAIDNVSPLDFSYETLIIKKEKPGRVLFSFGKDLAKLPGKLKFLKQILRCFSFNRVRKEDKTVYVRVFSNKQTHKLKLFSRLMHKLEKKLDQVKDRIKERKLILKQLSMENLMLKQTLEEKNRKIKEVADKFIKILKYKLNHEIGKGVDLDNTFIDQQSQNSPVYVSSRKMSFLSQEHKDRTDSL